MRIKQQHTVDRPVEHRPLLFGDLPCGTKRGAALSGSAGNDQGRRDQQGGDGDKQKGDQPLDLAALLLAGPLKAGKLIRLGRVETGDRLAHRVLQDPVIALQNLLARAAGLPCGRDACLGRAAIHQAG